MVMEVIPTVMDAIRQSMRHSAGDHLSVPQFRCLNFIERQPGCSIGDVAGFLGVTMPTASAMADRLVRAGLVLPQTASDDRRRSQLQPTDSGRAQLAQIQQGAQGDLEEALATCTRKELQTLQAGLAILRRTFRPDIERP
ncbi:MarR family winged helix-turn-helix transcriptional regulator [Rhodoferax sp.]|uniref:MarR family winged helix-turn-helix transcriptional regulator n=1 Tax=Rhodoferax sp. TaxID=50421 RepID=UPI00374CE898